MNCPFNGDGVHVHLLASACFGTFYFLDPVGNSTRVGDGAAETVGNAKKLYNLLVRIRDGGSLAIEDNTVHVPGQ